MKTITIIILFIALNKYSSPLQTKTIFIGYDKTKEPMIGAMIYSFETERCYNTNFDGLVTFPLVQGDSFQIEQTGYRLLNYSIEEIISFDSIYLKEIGDIELGTTGIEPGIAADKYTELCKCCKH